MIMRLFFRSTGNHYSTLSENCQVLGLVPLNKRRVAINPHVEKSRLAEAAWKSIAINRRDTPIVASRPWKSGQEGIVSNHVLADHDVREGFVSRNLQPILRGPVNFFPSKSNLLIVSRRVMFIQYRVIFRQEDGWLGQERIGLSGTFIHCNQDTLVFFQDGLRSLRGDFDFSFIVGQLGHLCILLHPEILGVHFGGDARHVEVKWLSLLIAIDERKGAS